MKLSSIRYPLNFADKVLNYADRAR